MPKVELTDRFCQTAKPPIQGQTDYFDTTVSGLCLRVSARTKAWYLIYSRPGERTRARMKLGAYPDTTLAKARQKARDTRAAVGEGTDPASEKRAQAASMTVSDLVQIYVARRASDARRGDEIERRLRHDLVPLIGKVKLADLHRRDLTRCIDAMMDRGAKAGANRLFDDIRAMVRWAKARGDLETNLVDGMQRPADTVQRDRVLTYDEVREVWHNLDSAEMADGTRRLLRLCLLTAQRVGEIGGMTRAEVDLDRALWTIPAARSKNGKEHAVPISNMAATVLREQLADVDALSERVGRPTPEFVFPAPGGRAAMTNSAASKAVKRQERIGSDGKPDILGAEPWTPHDLRRTAATLMEEAGVSPFVVGQVLNHVSITKASITSRVYARYNYEKEKREALDILAARVTAIVGEGGAQITPMKDTRRG